MTNFSKQILDNIANAKFDNRPLMEKALQTDSLDTLSELTSELIEQGFTDDARFVLENLKQNHRGNDQINLNLAEIYIEDGDDDQALTLLELINKNSDLYLSAQIDKADLYESEGLTESAEGVLLDLQTTSDNPLVRFALAEFYDAEGESGKSVQLYDYLINQGQNQIADINLHARLAVALTSNGEFEEAISEFEKIGVKNLSAKELSNLAQAYMQTKEPDKAEAVLKENMENEEATLADYLNLSDIYEQRADYEQQIRILQLAKSIDPYDLQTRFRLALAQSHLGHFDDADKELSEIIKKDPSKTEAISLLASNLLEIKRYSEVISLLNQHLEDEEIDQHYFWYLGMAYFNTDQQQQAEKNLLQVSDYFDDQAGFLKDAFFVFRNTDLQRSQKFLAKYLKLVPDDFDMENYLAE
ncbi:MAG: tetratricopeptide repeat protein [Oenococcus sp.]|uniref:tetratricopeptide repeat protein n=1 Tax=Oenococcus TaxID=46254 RepID=UPI0021E935FC|nr:tetratricopeptide repeat protein [Oenococcus kitaharae]MCV3295804.1 tetratricopeptide repeat protein [Oenococcus kitaharae]